MDATLNCRKAEFVAKRAEIQKAQHTSPSLRTSFKTPGPRTDADEAIELASELPSEDVRAKFYFLEHEIILLKACGFEVASEAASKDVIAELSFLRRKTNRLESVRSLRVWSCV
jgi:hypothetical protein